MIGDLLPTAVARAEAFEDCAEDELFPQERALLGNAVERRRREFTTVRACARRALAELGLPPAPVLPGVRNAPRWPEGIVGSMTHCDGYRAAALAWAKDMMTVGIDAEPDLPLRPNVVDSIALPGELSWVRAAQPGSVHRDRLLFSAKECVYKAWYPMMRSELDFDDADITFTTRATTADGSAGTFDARVLRPARHASGRWVDGFRGRWAARRGLIVTTIALPTEER